MRKTPNSKRDRATLVAPSFSFELNRDSFDLNSYQFALNRSSFELNSYSSLYWTAIQVCIEQLFIWLEQLSVWIEWVFVWIEQLFKFEFNSYSNPTQWRKFKSNHLTTALTTVLFEPREGGLKETISLRHLLQWRKFKRHELTTALTTVLFIPNAGEEDLQFKCELNSFSNLTWTAIHLSWIADHGHGTWILLFFCRIADHGHGTWILQSQTWIIEHTTAK